jgi:hypothetical protein
MPNQKAAPPAASKAWRGPPLRFLLIATAVVALLHVYIGWRLLPELALGAFGQGLVVAYLALSTLLVPAGLLARVIERQQLADTLAWIGLLTTGYFSSLLVLTVLREPLLLLAAWLLRADHIDLHWAHGSAVAVPLLAALFTLVGFVNARSVPRIVEVDIPLPELPPALQGLTIVQLSDIHIGPTIKGAMLARIVDRVNRLQPDIIAITGDLVDGPVAQLAAHTAPLAALSARHGTFFVTGNHEYYAGAPAWIAELRRLGIRVLLNEHVLLDHDGVPLLLAGVTDYSAHHFIAEQRSDPQAALAGAPEHSGPKILLAHQPRSAPAAAAAGFDLQLSGHTHGGQFFPWNFFVRLQQPYTAGLNRLGRLWVYTSRGTGYWGPPKRLFAPSEITRLRLTAATGATLQPTPAKT